jgi:hypothetical protein
LIWQVAQVHPKLGVAEKATPPTSPTLAGMSTVGYSRVSTDHQSVLAQRDALTVAGWAQIFTERVS